MMKARTKSKEVQDINQQLKDYKEEFGSRILESGLDASTHKFKHMMDDLYDYLSVQYAPEPELETRIDMKLDNLGSRISTLSKKGELFLSSIEGLSDSLYDWEHPPAPKPVEAPKHRFEQIDMPLTGTRFEPMKDSGPSLLQRIIDFFKKLFKK
ncbi:hypothetical protein JW968_01545 [Candidatus Woesearchaeota archaeon]|nr:hypothetical protein [Candidatus Woesearchaeota archaeon]